MRPVLVPAALLIAAWAGQQAQAQSGYRWKGPTLLSAGLTTSGCNLRVPIATHGGSLALNSIFVDVQNLGSRAVQITGEVELSGNNSRKSGTISRIIQGNGVTASMHAMTPGGSTLDNTTLRVNITSCALYTS